jgi:hypothetical protein
MMVSFYQHLYHRGLRDYHRYWSTGELPTNPNEEHVVFPLIAPGGKYVGHQRYYWRRPKLRSNDEQGRYISTFLPEYKLTAFFGYEYTSWPTSCLFVTEGVWDCIRVANCGVNCLALLTATPSKCLRQYLRMLVGDCPLVALIDRDENKAGESLGKFCDYQFEPPGIYEDFNDIPPVECFKYIIEIENRLCL